jgi:hypothetical protein
MRTSLHHSRFAFDRLRPNSYVTAKTNENNMENGDQEGEIFLAMGMLFFTRISFPLPFKQVRSHLYGILYI